MANTFFPVVSTIVEASTGYNQLGKDYHPQNTDYKISIGYEITDGDDNCLVQKVQIRYDGKIVGRRSASFPIKSNDWENVKVAMDRVEAFYIQQTNKSLRNCII
ncbi:hypothetical protein [Paenisporosarcina antarctica]|uniref:Uncharacterized protein n=1 Tax=Paenisporosarcina antarctica TaxID=417367 RepID=A0A4P7A2N7_9BACL|nr:hypothetical protein [Paenisporosarcina antarctica]QBP43162.1 hypothetical protein E2636_18555 [Paenisporosarcina antarctica]